MWCKQAVVLSNRANGQVRTQGEARQGKAVRGEVRHNKARGMATGVWAKGLQPASLARIMTGRLLRQQAAAVAAGSKKEEMFKKGRASQVQVPRSTEQVA